jgi:hypothetical protein
MENERFDRLARCLASALTRRTTLAAGAALGILPFGSDARKRRKKKKCRNCSDCQVCD